MSRAANHRLTSVGRLNSRVLAHLQAHGPTNTLDLAVALSETRKAISVSVGELMLADQVHRTTADGTPTKEKTSIYAAGTTQTATAAPRTLPAKSEPWNGVAKGLNWAQSTLRPGCQDFLAIPSLRGQERHPHRTVVPMGAGKPLGPDSGPARTRFQN